MNVYSCVGMCVCVHVHGGKYTELTCKFMVNTIKDDLVVWCT